MPISPHFAERLEADLPAIAEHFGTPFHIYDERGILTSAERLLDAFAGLPFYEYYAVKALPNLTILRILREHGLGMECSSIAELELAADCGAYGEEVFFTSNNTTRAEFAAALALGAIVNVDDISLIAKLPGAPAVTSFRFNPGPERVGDRLIGSPLEAKFGLRRDQLEGAYAQARELGAERFGVHAMIASNVLTVQPLLATIAMLLEIEEQLQRTLGIALEFVNAGGGLGIPYRPGDPSLDVEALGRGAGELLESHAARSGRHPQLFLEAGRFITGPHGVLVTRVINRMSKWREYAGVDAGIAALIRPAFYADAYHHLTLHGGRGERPLERIDVVGSLCENNDKFAIQRELPQLREGDLLLIHDTGAHSLAMGFNYNGRLRPQELLLRSDGSVELIRRAEEVRRDYLATLQFERDVLAPAGDEARGERRRIGPPARIGRRRGAPPAQVGRSGAARLS
ncbi:MAG TPA: diaminopimelate decarboxylase [Solirubrobacteraceae bacterium]|jgi:diaminopimelate decarboxylase|nr:diaminopimelate decarboxylase [Solirubrobacteraceae bacterium]